MCECGCIANDERYKFPGPGRAFYLLTLSKGCLGCDAQSGVSIELIEPGSFIAKYIKDYPDYLDGELKFEDWRDSKGVGIVTGMLRHEFIEALSKHLIGVSSDELGENGKIDEAGADVILEEMYEDAVVKPHFPVPQTA